VREPGTSLLREAKVESKIERDDEGVGHVSALTRTYVWARIELGRFVDALRGHWKRVLVGALVGWLFAVVGGAFALASLEFHHIVSTATSDELGIVIALYGVGIGALNAYTFRPVRQ